MPSHKDFESKHKKPDCVVFDGLTQTYYLEGDITRGKIGYQYMWLGYQSGYIDAMCGSTGVRPNNL